MKSLIAKILDRFFVVLFACIFLQIPQFMHQYELQLVGHVNELKWQIGKMEEAASQSGKTIDQYIQKFVSHEDKDFSNQGLVMAKVKKRWNTLSRALAHLKEASMLLKPFYFVTFCDIDLLKSTFHSFHPGLELTIESFFYAIIGMLIGFIFFQSLLKLFQKTLQ